MPEICTAAIQPGLGVPGQTPGSIVQDAFKIAADAARQKVDIVCFPEYLNCMSFNGHVAIAEHIEAEKIIDQAAEYSRTHNCYCVLPLVISQSGRLYNRTFVIDRQGTIIGKFDKVHLTGAEKDNLKLTPGTEWPVFDCDFGRIGIMVCYDGCFTEPPRVFSLLGARMIFWPSLQRLYQPWQILLQAQSHAFFNFVAIIRSSYGLAQAADWKPGIPRGTSCICDSQGCILADAGQSAGIAFTRIDLDLASAAPAFFSGPLTCLKSSRFKDRRPETYHKLWEHVNDSQL